jgi:hypothetical protein
MVQCDALGAEWKYLRRLMAGKAVLCGQCKS